MGFNNTKATLAKLIDIGTRNEYVLGAKGLPTKFQDLYRSFVDEAYVADSDNIELLCDGLTNRRVISSLAEDISNCDDEELKQLLYKSAAVHNMRPEPQLCGSVLLKIENSKFTKEIDIKIGGDSDE